MLRLFRLCLHVSAFRTVALCSLLAALCGGEIHAKDRVAAEQRRPVSTSMNALAKEVGGIANDASLSRARKANRISSTVREVLAAATAAQGDPEELLAITLKVTRVAASSAPRFADVIAGAAALSPVGKESGAGGRIRTAAYKAAADPTSVTEQDLLADSATFSTQSELPPIADTAPVFIRKDGMEEPVARVASPSAANAVESSPTPDASSEAEAPANGQVVEAAETPAVDSEGKPTGVVKLEKFEVKGEVVKGSVLAERRKGPVAVDLMTSRDFSKFIATDVSDIVIRLPGFSTTTRGSFAVVRGLAERYNPIMLDGIVLPSSDPERQSPELDMFPTRLVDAIVVSKVFEPRLPAIATGGAVDLRTKPLPEQRFAQIQFGVRADEGALKGDEFYGYKTAGIWDRVALGTKDRPAAPDSGASGADAAQFRSRLTNRATPMSNRLEKYPGGIRLGVVYENRIDLGDDGRALGYSFNFNYDSSASTAEGRSLTVPQLVGLPTNITAPEPTTGVVFEGNDYLESEKQVRVGLLANLGYAFNKQHIVSLSAFVSQIATDTASRTFNGFSGGGAKLADIQKLWQAFDTGVYDPAIAYNLDDERISQSQSLHYRQRNLTDLKVSGQHEFSNANQSKLNWGLARISASQDEPDFWSISNYIVGPTDPSTAYATILLGTSGRGPTRYWREVQENTWTGRLDGESRFDLGWMRDVTAQVGIFGDSTKRSFTEKSFVLTAGDAGAPKGDNLEELVAIIRRDARIEGNYRTNILLPFADADRKLKTAYASLTFPLLAKRPWAEKLDLLVGARLEKYQLLSTGLGAVGNAESGQLYITPTARNLILDAYLPASATAVERQIFADKLFGVIEPGRVFTGAIDESTWHPAAALTWSPLPRLNVRASYSQTVGRPSFRELGPYFTKDEISDEYQIGNVFLQTSPVKNIDFRIEYFFPNSRDLVALSYFNKRIERPIERSVLVMDLVSRSTASWFNNPNTAVLKGAEFEAAKNLKFLGEVGSWFTLGGNATFIDGKVARSSSEPIFPDAADKRRLFDQPEWIANAYLTFDHNKAGFSTTLSWFAISDVLQKIGVDTWSTYTAAHSRLDLTLSQRIGRHWLFRFSAKNLTDPVRKFIADPEITTEEVVLRTFKDGRSYTLTATYDF